MNMLPLAGRMEILRQRLVAIAERMGETLARTAYSANIKERRDHSCAIFDADGRLLAQAAHIPVHLGSMAVSVEAARQAQRMRPGDVVVLNDPYCGGTHLPDLTLVAPVYVGDVLKGFVANRAHHADVGGATPGSMGAATSIHQEGLRIPPVKWFAEGREQEDIRRLLLANVRSAHERLGDLRAQFAANEVGRGAFVELLSRYDPAEFAAVAAALMDYAETRMRAAIRTIPDGTYRHTDYLEGDGVTDAPIPITVTLTIKDGEVVADFTGTSPGVTGCVNCPPAVTRAAVAYVFVCLAAAGDKDGSPMPHNAGMDRPIRILAEPGSLVHAAYPSAVAAGNVETSQRIVDVLLGALAQAAPELIPAASAGTMTSVSFGGEGFTYYETIGGGAGASPYGPGESGIHTHMTNTRNTPIEALEMSFPLRVRRYGLAANTGGAGRHRGGDGIIRQLTALAPMSGAILADRHRAGPSGREGGSPGRPGSVQIVGGDGSIEPLGSKTTFELRTGDTLEVATPGGGGYGEPG